MNQSQMACPAYTHSSMNCFIPLSSSIGVCAAHGIFHYSLSRFNAISGSTTNPLVIHDFYGIRLHLFHHLFHQPCPKFSTKKLVQRYIYFGEIFSIFFFCNSLYFSRYSIQKFADTATQKNSQNTNSHSIYSTVALS